MNRFFCSMLFLILTLFVTTGCAKPLAEGKLMAMEPVTSVVAADANSIYYAIRWAFDESGLPIGHEDLTGGVIESKWVPVGAASHYVYVMNMKDYGANAAYYKMVIKIDPIGGGKCTVVARTDVKSIVRGIKSSGDKERDILEKIAEHARGYDVSVTNLGIEE